MPGIDREFLTEVLADLKRQENEGLTQAHRARGAIMLAEALMNRLAEAPKAEAVEKSE